MGYESRLYVVEKRLVRDEDGRRFSSVIAMFDLSKCYFLSGELRNRPVANCYFYADDFNTRVTKDRYGQPLTETTVEDVVRILEEAIRGGADYRYISPLLSFMKGLDSQMKNGIWGEVAVLHFGY